MEDLVADAQCERQACECAESDLEAADSDRDHDTELRNQRRLLNDKDGALQNAMSEMAQLRGLLSQREGDLQAE